MRLNIQSRILEALASSTRGKNWSSPISELLISRVIFRRRFFHGLIVARGISDWTIISPAIFYCWIFYTPVF
jgi:hypothetical protein